MSMAGQMLVLLAFSFAVVAAACLAGGLAPRVSVRTARALLRVGRAAACAPAALLTACTALLAWCFLVDDPSLMFVVENRSDAVGPLAWLFSMSGVWSGSQGSFLFWAWAQALFAAAVAVRGRASRSRADDAAACAMQLVLAVLAGVLSFADGYAVFAPIDPRVLAVGTADSLGMNPFLEHWAMAIHPPLLLMGYAGLSVPFCYAVGSFFSGGEEGEGEWASRARGFLLFSWMLLTAGIGLGALWAYSIVGWGGYWGWDPVESASLVVWLLSAALVHALVLGRHGRCLGWCVVCAGAAFSSVILSALVSRTGVVRSMHAYAADVSAIVPFVVCAALPLVASAWCLAIRRWSIGCCGGRDVLDALGVDAADGRSRVRRRFPRGLLGGSVVLAAMALLLEYAVLLPALPFWLPFGGMEVSADSLAAAARILGIVFCAAVSVVFFVEDDPVRADGSLRGIVRRIAPILCAAGLAALFIVAWLGWLFPSFVARMSAGARPAEAASAVGPEQLLFVEAFLGLAVSAAVLCAAGRPLVSSATVLRRMRSKGWRGGCARAFFSRAGVGIVHASLGLLLVGLVGASLHATMWTGALSVDAADGKDALVPRGLAFGDYRVDLIGFDREQLFDGGESTLLRAEVFCGDASLGFVAAFMEADGGGNIRMTEAGIAGNALADVSVMLAGVGEEGDAIIAVRVTPLVRLLWLGWALLMGGLALGCLFGESRHAAGCGCAFSTSGIDGGRVAVQ